jgi:phage gpG-like protein
VPAVVQIKNLKEVRKAMKAAEMGVGELKDANQTVADFIHARATAKMPSRSGKLRASYVAKGTQTQAYIKSKLIYAGVQEFGGTVYWRPRGGGGRGWGSHKTGHRIPVKPKAPNESYYIYPTIRAYFSDIQDAYEDKIVEIIQRFIGG